jgi:hypothetical protein
LVVIGARPTKSSMGLVCSVEMTPAATSLATAVRDKPVRHAARFHALAPWPVSTP